MLFDSTRKKLVMTEQKNDNGRNDNITPENKPTEANYGGQSKKKRTKAFAADHKRQEILDEAAKKLMLFDAPTRSHTLLKCKQNNTSKMHYATNRKNRNGSNELKIIQTKSHCSKRNTNGQGHCQKANNTANPRLQQNIVIITGAAGAISGSDKLKTDKHRNNHNNNDKRENEER